MNLKAKITKQIMYTNNNGTVSALKAKCRDIDISRTDSTTDNEAQLLLHTKCDCVQPLSFIQFM